MKLQCFRVALLSSLIGITVNSLPISGGENEFLLAQVGTEAEMYCPKVNMVDNYRISVGGGPNGGTGDFDVPGFMMSMSGIPGYDLGTAMGSQMGMSFAAGDVAMQRLMTQMRAVGARAGMSGSSGI